MSFDSNGAAAPQSNAHSHDSDPPYSEARRLFLAIVHCAISIVLSKVKRSSRSKRLPCVKRAFEAPPLDNHVIVPLTPLSRLTPAVCSACAARRRAAASSPYAPWRARPRSHPSRCPENHIFSRREHFDGKARAARNARAERGSHDGIGARARGMLGVPKVLRTSGASSKWKRPSSEASTEV